MILMIYKGWSAKPDGQKGDYDNDDQKDAYDDQNEEHDDQKEGYNDDNDDYKGWLAKPDGERGVISG